MPGTAPGMDIEQTLRAMGVKTAIVTNGLSDDITIVDMQSMKPVKSIPAGRTPHSVVIDD